MNSPTFTLEKPPAIPTTDEFLLNQVPGAQVVSLYKITSSVTQYQNPIQIVIPIDIPFSGAVNDYVTELYRWDGSSYTTLRIDKGATNFLYEPIRLATGGDTFVAVRAPISAVITACTAQAGTFNGAYCELPFDSVANSAAVQPGNTRARALDQYKMVSFNVGNAVGSGPNNELLYCGSLPPVLPVVFEEAQTAYVFKLCSYAIEREVREALRQDGITSQIDLLALQELWNNDCSTSLDTPLRVVALTHSGPAFAGNGDRVCAVPPPPPFIARKQIERLVPISTFDYHCSPVVSFPASSQLSKRKTNGFECIAIRKQHFEFAVAEFGIPTVQPACPGATASTTTYYEGSDTGFQIERVRLKGSLGPAADATFDFANAHLISPLSIACRRAQFSALNIRYRVGANRAPLRVLVAGDMNTDPTRDAYGGDSASAGARTFFNLVFNLLGTAINAPTDIKMGYLLDDPAEVTATSFLGLFNNPQTIEASLDHVISNFADATSVAPACSRRVQLPGTDHKRTICILIGLDSGSVRAGMQLTDLADVNAPAQVWVGGTVTSSRRGVVLNYAKTTLINQVYVTAGLASNLSTILYYQACSKTTPVPKTNTPIQGGTFSLGTINWTVPLNTCP